MATIARLERVLPIAIPRVITSGELLARFVGDVDALQDLWVRVVLPCASAALVGVCAVALVMKLVPAAGVALATSFAVAAILVPMLSLHVAQGAAGRLAPLRGAFQTEVLDVLEGATELAIYGALPARLTRLEELDRAMVRASAESAAASGAGAGSRRSRPGLRRGPASGSELSRSCAARSPRSISRSLRSCRWRPTRCLPRSRPRVRSSRRSQRRPAGSARSSSSPRR